MAEQGLNGADPIRLRPEQVFSIYRRSDGAGLARYGGMDASLVISVVALAGTAWSIGLSTRQTRFTGEQAEEARLIREIEADRRLEELEPKMVAVVESVGGAHRLLLVLKSRRPLHRLELRIIQGGGDNHDETVAFTPGTNGVEPASFEDPSTSRPLQAVYAEPAPLTQGAQYRWSLEYVPQTGPEQMAVLAICHGAGLGGKETSWTVLLDEIRLPHNPPIALA